MKNVFNTTYILFKFTNPVTALLIRSAIWAASTTTDIGVTEYGGGVLEGGASGVGECTVYETGWGVCAGVGVGVFVGVCVCVCVSGECGVCGVRGVSVYADWGFCNHCCCYCYYH